MKKLLLSKILTTNSSYHDEDSYSLFSHFTKNLKFFTSPNFKVKSLSLLLIRFRICKEVIYCCCGTRIEIIFYILGFVLRYFGLKYLFSWNFFEKKGLCFCCANDFRTSSSVNHPKWMGDFDLIWIKLMIFYSASKFFKLQSLWIFLIW